MIEHVSGGLPTSSTVMRRLYGPTRGRQLEAVIVAGTLNKAPNLAGALWLPDVVGRPERRQGTA